MSLINYIIKGQTSMALILILSRAFVVFCCLPIHELAHGWVAYKMGDNTAKDAGRLTFNPIAHLNPIGTLMIFFFGIGYANPVPINPARFREPRKGMALTALAGPVSNLLMGFISICFYYFIAIIANGSSSTIIYFIASFFYYAAMVNVSLAVFNLIPIPPLDGAKVLGVILPDRTYWKIMQYERYIMLALMLLLFTGALNGVISVLSNALINFISIIPRLIYNIFV